MQTGCPVRGAFKLVGRVVGRGLASLFSLCGCWQPWQRLLCIYTDLPLYLLRCTTLLSPTAAPDPYLLLRWETVKTNKLTNNRPANQWCGFKDREVTLRAGCEPAHN